MAAADRLSALADDILQRILSFAPLRDAAASAILPRRWRPLWRRTSFLNLDSRPYSSSFRLRDPRLDAFFHHASAALADRRSGTELRRLALVLTEDAYLLHGEDYWMRDVEPEQDVRVAGLLADPATAALEELRINADGNKFVPPLAFLPCAATTLRVLELDCCNLEPSAGLAFPRLRDLTMRRCNYLAGCLQAVVDAAPAITSLTLVEVTNKSPAPPNEPLPFGMTRSAFNLPLRLRCPTVTDFVLVTNMSLDLEEQDDSRDIGIQLDMPNLRSFRYWGFPVKFSLTSPAPGLARVDFDATPRENYALMPEPPSRMLRSFSGTRALKLHINSVEDIVAEGEEHGGDILPTFPNLKLLEIEGTLYNCSMALAMATLLRSCPAITELRVRLSNWEDYYVREGTGDPFAESMERFNRVASMCSAHRGIVEFGGVSELPDAFTNNCSFSYLQKVTLQFKSTKLNCFQVQLAKFLVENAVVLKEMHIEDGSQFWTDHLVHKVARWRADAFRRRNLTDTAGFRVY
ncbi:unnamed protein product [Alopecurus aequalis]